MPPIVTTLYLKSLKPKEQAYDISVGDNLYLRVNKTGSKSWRVIIKTKGQRTITTLGTFPEISLADAKKLALATKLEILEKKESIAFDKVALEWLELKATKVKSIKDTRLRLNKAFINYFKDKPIQNITPKDVIERLNTLYGKDGKFETIKRCCNIISQLERYAHTLGYIKSLQMQNINEVFKSPKPIHMATVHPNSLKDVIAALKRESQQSKNIFNIFLIAIYTLLRPSEYMSLRWSWIDFTEKVILIPKESMKMKRDFRVPISNQLETLLNSLRMQQLSDLVFPSPTNLDEPLSIFNFAKFLRTHGFKGILVPHGIRSIGRTWMAENTVDYAVAEMCLAHKVGSNVSNAYNRSDLLEERRIAMQRWCDFVESSLTLS